jgi:hypothetical protein
MSRKYNYIGYTSKTKKTPSLISGKSTKDIESLGLSFFCSCGSVTKVVENVENSSMEKMTQGGSVSKYRKKCKKCNGEHQSDITISLNSKLRDNVVKSNYNVFTDGDLIKLVRFDDLIGVNSSGKSLYMITNKSSICFNKKTKRFYYYRSYRKGNKIVSIGLRDVYIYLHEFMRRLVLNEKVCFNEANKVCLIRNINKDYIEPFNKFLNILLQFVDKRDVDRLTHFLEPLKVIDVPTVNQSQIKGLELMRSSNSINFKNLTNSVISNFHLVISLIQYPNLSVLLFNLKKEKYINLLDQSAPVSFFKKRKDLSQREIVQNIYIGKINYLKQVRRGEFKYYGNKEKGVTYSQIKKRFSKILIPEHFSKYKKDMKSIEDFALKNKLICKDFDPFDSPDDIVTYNTLSQLKTIEQTSEYVKFLRKNKLPKYIIKDFLESPEGSLMSMCQTYYSMLYNEILDESEFCSLAKKYKLFPFVSILSEYFHIIDYHESHNYVSSYEEAKEQNVFVKHFMNVYFNKSSHETREAYNDDFLRTNFIRTYRDTIEIFKERGLGFDEIFKCKTIRDIVRIHDHWSQIISLEKMKKFNDGIKSFSQKYSHIKEYSENDIQFKLIDNVNSLSEEGSKMKHCVKSYARGMSEGYHLIFSVKDLINGERATLQFQRKIEKNGLISWTFSQLKGKYNSQASERIIASIKLFVENLLLKNSIKVNISYKEWDLVIKNENEKSKNIPELLPFHDDIDAGIDNIVEDFDFFANNDLPF